MVNHDPEHRRKSNDGSTKMRDFELTIKTSETVDCHQIIVFKEVTEVSLMCKRVLNLNALAKLPQLNRLFIDTSIIDGWDLEYDDGFQSLETLNLRGEGVTDTVIKGVGNLQNLTHLDLSNCSISDRGICEVTTLRRLESLGIARTAISDRAIVTLLTLVNLRRLDVAGSMISDTGIDMLLEGLAGLESLMRMGEMIGDDGKSMGPCYSNAVNMESRAGKIDRSYVANKLSTDESDMH